ncbi:per1-like protein PGAP5 isoform X2 [Neodiprion pinetum]|uniref:Metallophosphoesterase 1 isoform X4 n=1 Tax=Neodiprion lecontei TaxID=441921 RepID=A0ABM3G8U6_NEOLC|nr:metallophosphoesterase 1 isoform X2 [Neodiprion pinetum]XP_046596665.1 metallophosphoesterase 1 isoform X4 [Neodiprion lecontei]
MNYYNRCILRAFFGLVTLFFYCEYAVHYLVIFQCGWPDLDAQKADPAILLNNAEERPVKVMFLSDTHLLGSRNGHWFDKLKREWQMYRAFQTAMTIHKPELVFILGDIFDEGLWCSSAEFDRYVARFNSLFYIPQNTQLYVVAGNHDMGFHYSTLNLSGAVFELSVMAWLRFGFVNAMNAPSVKRVSVRGNHFVLMNSMALEGDGCFLCKPTEMALNRIAKQLKCTKGIGSSCKSKDILKQYSKPILLQHYPMYRESDEICHEVDEAPANIKSEKFRERWECLSKEASEQLLDIMEPRLIVNGHTHHGCRRIHRENILEFTVPSFSWRNKNNPSFLLGVFTPNNYSVSKCYMPVETTVIGIYIIGSIVVFLYLVLKARRGFNYRRLVKLHP